MKIIEKQETENTLLSRKEYTLRVEFEGVTPSKKEVTDILLKELKAKEQFLIIRDIIVEYGTQQADVHAHVYTDEKEMARIEDLRMHKKIREKIEAEKKKAEEAKKAEEEAKAAEAEKAAEETPAEEAKEETPEEKPAEEKTEEKKEE